MTVRRVTAREFQRRFQRLEDPVLINDGIYFPKVDAMLMGLAEGKSIEEITDEVVAEEKTPKTEKSPGEKFGEENADYLVEGRTVTTKRVKKQKVELSKSAQAKGKMGRG